MAGGHGDHRTPPENRIDVVIASWMLNFMCALMFRTALLASSFMCLTLATAASPTRQPPRRHRGRYAEANWIPPESAADDFSPDHEYYWEAASTQTPTMFALRDPRFKLIQVHGL